MQLTPAQKTIVRDNHRFRVLRCGRRFGKTTLAVWEIFGMASARNDRKIAYIAPTYQQARDIAWEQLKKICESVISTVNESRLEIVVNTKYGGESKIVLRGWESIDTLRGQAFDFLVLDEIREMRYFETKWQQVLYPTLTDRIGSGLFISTPNGYDHFHKLCNEETHNPEYKTFHYTSYDNPHLPHSEIEKAKVSLTEDAFWQEYMADFRKFVGLIYKEFNRDINVIEPFNLPRSWQYFRSMDFGATNATVCLWFAVDNLENVYVFDEYYANNKPIASHADVIKAKTSGSYSVINTWGDPSAEQAILDYLTYGITIAPAVRLIQGGDKGWVRSGIEKVSELLKIDKNSGKPHLFIFNTCVNTIREFESYRWIEKRADGVDREEPLKVDDHCMDALRYFVVSYKAMMTTQEWGDDYVPAPQPNQFTGY